MPAPPMHVFSTIEELSSLHSPIALAIGVFDGVHLGHQEVIRDAQDFAATHHGTAVVLTFDPHPLRILKPDAAPRLLCSTRHKLEILKRSGVDHILVLPFTQATAQMDATQFVLSLVAACRPLGFISVGYTWSFGRARAGNIHMLMDLGQAHGFGVYGVPEVQADGEVVSSTRIREAVRGGDFARARRLLGRDYTVLGKVVKGNQFGRQLGFPTANVAVENEELPPNGVYAVTVHASRFPAHGLKGVANLGTRPTIEAHGERSLEVHLLDAECDLYGESLEVAFIKHIRPEQKFGSIEELKAQIARDVAQARK
jgi:riboflavin kinase/FMN adenylyltransferase